MGEVDIELGGVGRLLWKISYTKHGWSLRLSL